MVFRDPILVVSGQKLVKKTCLGVLLKVELVLYASVPQTMMHFISYLACPVTSMPEELMDATHSIVFVANFKAGTV